MDKPTFNLNDEVKVEFMGRITGIKYDVLKQLRYTIEDDKGRFYAFVIESAVTLLEAPEPKNLE